MSQEWDTTGFEIPTDSHADTCDAVKRIRDGLETIRFNYRGTTDPSISLSWGAAQVGTWWQDIGSAGSGASVTNPLYKIWDDLTGAAETRQIDFCRKSVSRILVSARRE